MNARWTSLLLFFAAALGAATPGLRGQALQLADGKVLLARVDDADGDGLRVRRLDNGGVLDLRWDHLTPGCADRIKREFDLVSDAEEEITVQADLVTYTAAGVPMEALGKIVSADGPVLVLQNKGLQIRIPKTDIRWRKAVEVPVSQVLTKDEFYSDRLTQVQPGDSADRHLQLAQDLIRVRDYERADEHIQTAQKLNNSRDPAKVASLADKLKRYRDSARERDLLDQIQVARARGTAMEFERGRKLIDSFEKQYPNSKLKADFEAEKKRFESSRARVLTGLVADQWRRAIQVSADKKCFEQGLTLAAAKQYAESKMKEDISARVASQMKLQDAEVKAFFADREKVGAGKRPEFFAYGIGSWVLGADAVLKDTKQGTANAARAQQQSDPDQAREVERLQRLLRAARDRQRAAQATGQGGAPKEPTDEDWWKDAAHNEKVSWLRAYYAEFGGDLKVSAAFVQPCVSCYGVGTIPEAGMDGKVVNVKCYLCRGTKWLRTFRAW